MTKREEKMQLEIARGIQDAMTDTPAQREAMYQMLYRLNQPMRLRELGYLAYCIAAEPAPDP